MIKKPLLLLFILFYFYASAQKKIVDNDSYKNWTNLESISPNISSLISNDGKFVIYRYGSLIMGSILVVKATSGAYKMEFKEASKASFTEDNRRVILMLPNDSMAILMLGTSTISYIKNVENFEIPNEGNGQWLAYRLKNSQKEIILKNLFSDEEKRYLQGEEYKFDNNGKVLVIKTPHAIVWTDISHNTSKNIINASIAFFPTFDKSNEQLVFIAKRKDIKEIYYYRAGMDSAISLVKDTCKVLHHQMAIIDGSLNFSPNGNKVFFKVKEIDTRDSAKKSDDLKSNIVEIWNYKDKSLVPEDDLSKENRVSLAVFDIRDPKVVLLTTPEIIAVDLYRNDYIIGLKVINGDSLNWSKNFLSLYLISVSDGSRREIKNMLSCDLSQCVLSPFEKFLVWFDDSDKQYYSFETRTGITRNFSVSINTPWHDDESDIINRRDQQFGIGGWISDDNALLIYDRYDIWKVDPEKINAPVNITNGLGRTNNIIFRRVGEMDIERKVINDTSLLLAGFNRINKENGFWTVNLKKIADPKINTMGPYVYHITYPSSNILIAPSEDIPQKAKHANIYIVRRMSANESPNLFVTTDFSHYQPITNIYPERQYNWLKTELIHWTMPGGKTAEGILYKPENLDPKKKYPIIYYYYEKLSDGLNVYKNPELSEGLLNIPWYVSNGYLIFIPNMYYETGHVAKSIVNTITSSVHHLSSYQWIDTTKMGLQGHSFGGFETVTLIAHTNLFTAAQESAGYVNSISYYNHRILSINRNLYFDVGQGNLAYSPWENPNIYIENSPIFHVQNINTPVLIMHNEKDGNVPFTQAIELYTSLRRLNKKVWMLQYNKIGAPEEGHVIIDSSKKLDFTIRQEQFFNFYLKGAKAPKWMLTAGYRGLELDN